MRLTNPTIERELTGVVVPASDDFGSAERSQSMLSAIATMRQNIADPLSLGDIADAACLSPFHFLRVFHRTIGIPPGEYLTALRLEMAKNLVVTSDLNATDICYAVGYNSPGTFTTRFAKLVGLPPRQLRGLVRRFEDYGIPGVTDAMERVAGAFPAAGAVTFGNVCCPATFRGMIFVGLFPKRVPQAIPIAGTLVTGSGPYTITAVSDGIYYVLAAAVPHGDLASLLMPICSGGLVGIGVEPLRVVQGHIMARVNVTLREPRVTDPPLVVALPVLLARNKPEFLSGK